MLRDDATANGTAGLKPAMLQSRGHFTMHRSSGRIPHGKEGWTAAEGISEPVTKRIRCRACGACFTKTHFYDTHIWACAEPPPPPPRLSEPVVMVMAPLR
eukprot:jgi/Tetstr1/423155/TSEL_013923.t1